MRQTKVIDAQDTLLGEEILNSKTPIIIRGAVKHWSLVETAQQDLTELQSHLLALYNQQPVMTYQVEAAQQGRYFYNDDCSALNFNKNAADLASFFEQVKNTTQDSTQPSIFIPSMHLDTYFPELRAQLPLTLEGVAEPIVQAWMGTPSVIACHFDAMKNLACCIAGERRFTLFPPEQVENLYVGPVDLTPAGQAISLVDMRTPDFDRFPKFKAALEAGEQAILQPGDALFLPSMWWHQVEGLAPFNLMVNFWWRTTPRILGEPLHALDHAMLSLRALPQEEKAAWRALFEHYIFADDAEQQDHIPDHAQGKLAPLDQQAARRLRAQLLNNLNR